MIVSQEILPKEPVRVEFDECVSPRAHGVQRIGRLRLPIAGAIRPWATLYRLPDARLCWVVRLWEVHRPVRRCVSTETLRSYAARSRMPSVVRAIDALVERARDGDG